jgi:hypothetical protein
MCLCQVSRLSRWRPRYLTWSDWGSWTSLILTGGQVAHRVVKVRSHGDVDMSCFLAAGSSELGNCADTKAFSVEFNDSRQGIFILRCADGPNVCLLVQCFVFWLLWVRAALQQSPTHSAGRHAAAVLLVVKSEPSNNFACRFHVSILHNSRDPHTGDRTLLWHSLYSSWTLWLMIKLFYVLILSDVFHLHLSCYIIRVSGIGRIRIPWMCTKEAPHSEKMGTLSGHYSDPKRYCSVLQICWGVTAYKASRCMTPRFAGFTFPRADVCIITFVPIPPKKGIKGLPRCAFLQLQTAVTGVPTGTSEDMNTELKSVWQLFLNISQ